MRLSEQMSDVQERKKRSVSYWVDLVIEMEAALDAAVETINRADWMLQAAGVQINRLLEPHLREYVAIRAQAVKLMKRFLDDK